MAITDGGIFLHNNLFMQIILPFVLVFTVVFAVLQKSQIFGEGKKQVDALVALVIGLIFVAFGQAVGIVLQIIPILAVSLIVILVLMLLLGMFSKAGDWDSAFPRKLRLVLMVVVIIAVVIAVMMITGAWNYLREMVFSENGSSTWLINIIFLIVIGGAVAAVLWGSNSSSS